MRTAKILQLPAADALWNEGNDLAEEVHDLVLDIPCPEVIQGIAYKWTPQSYADVRGALGLLRKAQELLEEVRDREVERFDAHNERLESMGIEP